MSNYFIYELLKPEDINAAAKVVVEAFLEQNAMYRAMKFTASDLYPYTTQVLPICVSEESAFCCKNEEGTMLGAALAYPEDADIFSRVKLGESGRMAEATPLFAQLAEKTEAPLKPLRKGKKMVEFALVGVNAEAKGNGIATGLYKFMLESLCQRFDAAYLNALSIASRKAAEKNGFIFLGETLYKDSGIEALKELEGGISLEYYEFGKKAAAPVK